MPVLAYCLQSHDKYSYVVRGWHYAIGQMMSEIKWDFVWSQQLMLMTLGEKQWSFLKKTAVKTDEEVLIATFCTNIKDES